MVSRTAPPTPRTLGPRRDAVTSVGSKSGSYECVDALAETVNGLRKTELTR